ncbi:MAG TPA: hypothetical protein VGE09_08570 [Pseudoxanthomonas sp.]
MDGANSPGQARAYWITPFPFQPSGGGLGVSLDCDTDTGTSSRTALVGVGNTFVISNTGDVWSHVAFGDGSIVATTAYMPIPPGTSVTISLNDDKESPWTHVAGITAGGSTTIQISRGFGI